MFLLRVWGYKLGNPLVVRGNLKLNLKARVLTLNIVIMDGEIRQAKLRADSSFVGFDDEFEMDFSIDLDAEVLRCCPRAALPDRAT